MLFPCVCYSCFKHCVVVVFCLCTVDLLTVVVCVSCSSPIPNHRIPRNTPLPHHNAPALPPPRIHVPHLPATRPHLLAPLPLHRHPNHPARHPPSPKTQRTPAPAGPLSKTQPGAGIGVSHGPRGPWTAGRGPRGGHPGARPFEHCGGIHRRSEGER